MDARLAFSTAPVSLAAQATSFVRDIAVTDSICPNGQILFVSHSSKAYDFERKANVLSGMNSGRPTKESILPARAMVVSASVPTVGPT